MLCENITLKQKLTNRQLYQELPTVSHKVIERKMKLISHCIQILKSLHHHSYFGDHQRVESTEVDLQSSTLTVYVKIKI